MYPNTVPKRVRRGKENKKGARGQSGADISPLSPEELVLKFASTRCRLSVAHLASSQRQAS